MKQTETYKLNLIDRDDPFSPEALNDNAEAIDAALARVDGEITRIDGALLKLHCGTYNGNNGANRKIDLPFTPKLVYVTGERYGATGMIDSVRGCVTIAGKPVTYTSAYSLLELVEDGFLVSYAGRSDFSTNTSGTTYRYFAIG